MSEKEFFYKKPHEQQTNKEERELGHHSIDLYLEGEREGRLIYSYFSNPIPTYFVEYIYIHHKHKGRGYGSEILEKANQILIDKKRMGVLINSMSNLKKDMYKRHGWIEWGRMEEENEDSFMMMYFNPPKWASKEDIDTMIKKLTKHSENIEQRKLKRKQQMIELLEKENV